MEKAPYMSGAHAARELVGFAAVLSEPVVGGAVEEVGATAARL